jgi:hypothetical protein
MKKLLGKLMKKFLTKLKALKTIRKLYVFLFLAVGSIVVTTCHWPHGLEWVNVARNFVGIGALFLLMRFIKKL